MSASARTIAAELLSAVLDERRTLDAALAANEGLDALSGRDRAFARAIVSATLRRLGGIDATLARFLLKPLPEDARLARALLRTGAAQMLAMAVAPHAVVSETVEAAGTRRETRGFAKLMNAVLRRVAELGPYALDAAPPEADLPDWLVARWRATYGEAAVRALAAALKTEPSLDLSVKMDAEGWAERLGGAALLGSTVRLAPGGPPLRERPGFEEGAWWVQDAAAGLPARLLAMQPGERVLDLCAAPGGKTLQLAAAGAAVTALDVSQDRLERVGENLARTGLEATLVAADARAWRPEAPFDAVLVDAPCTATGTLRRHPEAAWLRQPDWVPRFAALQGELVTAAAAMLKPGGRLVYAVCSLEPEEAESGVQAARAAGLTPDPIRPDELPGVPSVARPHGALRTLPHQIEGGWDGFFAARFVKA